MNVPAERPHSTANKLLVLFVGLTVLDLSFVCAVALTKVIASFGHLAALLLYAVVEAQFALAVAWAGLAPRPLFERNLMSVLAAAWWLGASMLPVALSGEEDEVFLRLFCVLPWALLTLQVPLWICRLAFGWHVVRGSEPGPVAPARRQFGVRQLMDAVTTVAVWLGLLRLSMTNLSEGDDFGWPAQSMRLNSWLGLLIVPCVYVAFGARRATEFPIVLIRGFGLLTLIVVGVACVISVDVGFPLAFHVTFLAVFYGTILVARREGFVLRWVARPKRSCPSSCARQ